MIAFLYIAVEILFLQLQGRFIFGGDSAEYSTIARVWGIAHPPGYPLYSFLANIINRVVPLGTTPWRVAFLSSIPTVITAYMIYRILRLLKLHPFIAFLTSQLYLFLFPIWLYALVPEVFALHTMFVSCITFLLLLYSKDNKKIYLLVAAFLCGLCVSHHHIFILFIPGWLYLLKDKLKKILKNKKLVYTVTLLTLLGASFYLYAVITSFSNTILDWTNAKTPLGLFQLITRSTYGSFKAYAGSGADIPNQISDVISSLVFIFLDFKLIGMVFIAVGLFVAHKRSARFASFLFISLATHMFFLFYTNFVLSSTFSDGMYERFLIPLYFVLIFFVGIGIDYLRKTFFHLTAHFIQNGLLKKTVNIFMFIFLGAFVFLIAIQSYHIIRFVPKTKIFDQFGKDILATVPKGGVLSTIGDNSTFSIYYHLYGLNERKDIAFVQLGLMSNTHYVELLKSRSPSLNIKKSISDKNSFQSFVSQNATSGYFADSQMGFGSWRPYGLLWKYYPDEISAASDSAFLLEENRRLWQTVYKIPRLSADEKNIFHANTVSSFYLNAYEKYSQFLVISNQYDKAEKVLKNLAMIYKKNDLQSEAVYMNLLVYEKKCKEASEIALKINLDETVKKYPGFVKSALPYLRQCDPKNERIPHFQQIQNDLDKNAKTSLNSF